MKTFLSFLISLNFLFPSVLAKGGAYFQCEFQAKGQKKNFTYNSEKDVGKSIKLEDHDLLMWHKDDFLMVKVRGGSFVKPLSIQFSLYQQTARFNLNPNLDLTCVGENLKKIKEGMKLTKDKEIPSLKERIEVIIKKPLNFRAYQPEETQLMRTLFFQNGNVYINSNDMEQKLPWCSLRVQIKEKVDTTVKPGDKFSPLSFQQNENNSYFTTYTYSFVDFGSGKKAGETATYAPFMFTCNAFRGAPFNLEAFKSIVGDFIALDVVSAL